LVATPSLVVQSFALAAPTPAPAPAPASAPGTVFVLLFVSLATSIDRLELVGIRLGIDRRWAATPSVSTCAGSVTQPVDEVIAAEQAVALDPGVGRAGVKVCEVQVCEVG
jgi:hypothetical protein